MAPCGWRWHTWRRGRELVAAGPQLGAVYELRYRLERERLFLEVVGERSRDVECAANGVQFVVECRAGASSVGGLSAMPGERHLAGKAPSLSGSNIGRLRGC